MTKNIILYTLIFQLLIVTGKPADLYGMKLDKVKLSLKDLSVDVDKSGIFSLRINVNDRLFEVPLDDLKVAEDIDLSTIEMKSTYSKAFNSVLEMGSNEYIVIEFKFGKSHEFELGENESRYIFEVRNKIFYIFTIDGYVGYNKRIVDHTKKEISLFSRLGKSVEVMDDVLPLSRINSRTSPHSIPVKN
jgi:hypothetical protein